MGPDVHTDQVAADRPSLAVPAASPATPIARRAAELRGLARLERDLGLLRCLGDVDAGSGDPTLVPSCAGSSVSVPPARPPVPAAIALTAAPATSVSLAALAPLGASVGFFSKGLLARRGNRRWCVICGPGARSDRRRPGITNPWLGEWRCHYSRCWGRPIRCLGFRRALVRREAPFGRPARRGRPKYGSTVLCLGHEGDPSLCGSRRTLLGVRSGSSRLLADIQRFPPGAVALDPLMRPTGSGQHQVGPETL